MLTGNHLEATPVQPFDGHRQAAPQGAPVHPTKATLPNHMLLIEVAGCRV